MSVIQYRQVQAFDVPSNTRSYLGKYARLFTDLLELSPGVFAGVEVACKKDGYNMTRELRYIAEKEGMTLHWSRNRLHTEFFYRVERPKAEIRRMA